METKSVAETEATTKTNVEVRKPEGREKMATIEENALELETLGYTLLESCVDVEYTENALKEFSRNKQISACPRGWMAWN